MPDVPDALIQMRRAGCAFDKCPVYSVSIFGDGIYCVVARYLRPLTIANLPSKDRRRSPSWRRTLRPRAAVQRLPPSRLSSRLLVGAAYVLMARQARAVDPFEIQVYDATINQPGEPGIELHVNSVVSGLRTAVPPELPPDHQTHFTLEPSFGLTPWWELGGYLQFTLRADGTFDYGGVKLRSKLVHPPTADSPFGVGINLEISRLPDSYDRDRSGAEVRPIATATVGGERLFFSVNPIVDLSLAGPGASGAPSFEPAATALYVVGGLCSFGLEYYANLGPIGSWLPAKQQEHYLYEVANVLHWRRWEINLGVGEGLTGGSNRLIAKTIAGFR